VWLLEQQLVLHQASLHQACGRQTHDNAKVKACRTSAQHITASACASHNARHFRLQECC
jgi:hypothetical protein